MRVISALLIRFSKAERKTWKEESDLYSALTINWSTLMSSVRIDMFVLQTSWVEAGVSCLSVRFWLVPRSRGGVRDGDSGPVDEEAGDRGGGEFMRIFFPALGVCAFKAEHSAWSSSNSKSSSSRRLASGTSDTR